MPQAACHKAVCKPFALIPTIMLGGGLDASAEHAMQRAIRNTYANFDMGLPLGAYAIKEIETWCAQTGHPKPQAWRDLADFEVTFIMDFRPLDDSYDWEPAVTFPAFAAVMSVTVVYVDDPAYQRSHQEDPMLRIMALRDSRRRPCPMSDADLPRKTHDLDWLREAYRTQRAVLLEIPLRHQQGVVFGDRQLCPPFSATLLDTANTMFGSKTHQEMHTMLCDIIRTDALNGDPYKATVECVSGGCCWEHKDEWLVRRTLQ